MRSTRTVSSKWLRRAFNVERNTVATELPLYLCPGLIGPTRATLPSSSVRNVTRLQTHRFYSTAPNSNETTHTIPLVHPTRPLPVVCSGCGALSQTAEPNQAGYYDIERKAVKSYLGLTQEEKRVRKEDLVVQEALKNLNLDKLGKVGDSLRTLAETMSASATPSESTPDSESAPPLCDRCHHLIHHNQGNPIYHPTVASIRDTIEESPYKYNHIYHVVDAADFPMSLIPAINDLLEINPLRSLNRRSRAGKYIRGRKTELSFIITRSDLLGPTKKQVDSLMPQLTEMLRTALGRRGRNVRLGNVWCVSAKRGWWHKEIKEEVWKQGGASWMVGKVNVGKSQLFEAIFPKGRMDWKPPKDDISVEVFADPFESNFRKPNTFEPEPADETSLLPPAQEETNYPAMPVVSSLPGTTASPIRVPFGNGRGELIDLPGLARSNLENHVQEEHRASLVMKHRVVPEQEVLKPGKSLLIGGLIRITPKTPDLIFLACSFTPIEAHLTSTEKAIAVQEQREDAPNVTSIAAPGTGELIKSAGTFELSYDVTKQRAGPITRKEAVNMSVDRLPYRVLGIDILIEGVGWVEVVAQMRVKDLEAKQQPQKPKVEAKPQNPDRLESLDLLSDETDSKTAEEETDEPPKPNWPVIEVFSPEGKFIAARKPINGWMLNKPKKQDIKKRPRPSMKGAKKREKVVRRMGSSGDE